MAKSGLQWMFGYLFRNPKFLVIPLQTALMPQAERVTYP